VSRKDDIEQSTRECQDPSHQYQAIRRGSESPKAKARARRKIAEQRKQVQGQAELDALVGDANQDRTVLQESTPRGPGGTSYEGDRHGRVIAPRPVKWFVYSLLSFAVTTVVVFSFLRPLRCLVEHRIIEAQVALIVALAGAIGAVLLKLVVGDAQSVFLGLLGGIGAALLLEVMVTILLPRYSLRTPRVSVCECVRAVSSWATESWTFAGVPKSFVEEPSDQPHVRLLRSVSTGHLIRREQIEPFITAVRAFWAS
jgi:hypothetical protein